MIEFKKDISDETRLHSLNLILSHIKQGHSFDRVLDTFCVGIKEEDYNDLVKMNNEEKSVNEMVNFN